MIEILKQLKTFNISTPLNPERLIDFSEPFKDPEFDGFEIKDNKLLLSRKGAVVARLNHINGFLSGRDTRGGYTVLKPIKNDSKTFRDFFKVNRSEKFVKEEQPEKLNTEVVIVTDSEIVQGVTDFKVVKAPKRLFDIFDQAFKDGANYVFNTAGPVSSSDIRLLYILSETYLKGNVGSVQLYSTYSTQVNTNDSDIDKVTYENGDWSFFSISADVWAIIRTQMDNREYNFYGNLKRMFKNKGLKRIAPKVCRVNNKLKSDEKLKEMILDV